MSEKENIYPIIKSAEETKELVNKAINPMRVKKCYYKEIF